MEIIKRFAIKDKRIIIVSQSNSGVSAARNNGLKYVHGQFIMFVDSDDWIDKQTCELAIQKIKQKNADVVLWTYSREYPHSSKINYYFGGKELFWHDENTKVLWRRMIGPIGKELQFPQNLDSMITVWGKLYNRKVLEGFGFVDTDIIATEDTLFNIQVFSHIKSAVYIPKALYHYRKEDTTSLTHLYKKQKVFQWKILYQKIEAYLRTKNISDKYYQALSNRIALGLIGLGLNLAEDTTWTFCQKKNELKKILQMQHYRRAVSALQIKYFPTHWKIFFICAKHNWTVMLTILLIIMNKIRGF